MWDAPAARRLATWNTEQKRRRQQLAEESTDIKLWGTLDPWNEETRLRAQGYEEKLKVKKKQGKRAKMNLHQEMERLLLDGTTSGAESSTSRIPLQARTRSRTASSASTSAFDRHDSSSSMARAKQARLSMEVDSVISDDVVDDAPDELTSAKKKHGARYPMDILSPGLSRTPSESVASSSKGKSRTFEEFPSSRLRKVPSLPVPEDSTWKAPRGLPSCPPLSDLLSRKDKGKGRMIDSSSASLLDIERLKAKSKGKEVSSSPTRDRPPSPSRPPRSYSSTLPPRQLQPRLSMNPFSQGSPRPMRALPSRATTSAGVKLGPPKAVRSK